MDVSREIVMAIYKKRRVTGNPPHFLQKKLNYPLHNRLPVFFDCHSKNSLSNELKHFLNRRCDFSLLGSLSAVTKLPKAFFFIDFIKYKIYHDDVVMVQMQNYGYFLNWENVKINSVTSISYD